MTSRVATSFACPVCLERVTRPWVWREPQSDRLRVYCVACAALPEYRGLREEECLLYSEESFNRMAGERLLRHIAQREHAEA